MSKDSSKIIDLEDYKEKHNPFDRHELCRGCIDYDDCDFDCQDYKELTWRKLHQEFTSNG